MSSLPVGGPDGIRAHGGSGQLTPLSSDLLARLHLKNIVQGNELQACGRAPTTSFYSAVCKGSSHEGKCRDTRARARASLVSV